MNGREIGGTLFLIPILHQTTTYICYKSMNGKLFLIPILHQTTTIAWVVHKQWGCSSFQFYIKPQHLKSSSFSPERCSSFQFYIKPQPSATNTCNMSGCSSFQFYIKPQHVKEPKNGLKVVPHSNSTSNHNRLQSRAARLSVVPHSNSTSNHNLAHGSNSYSARYTYDTDA